MIGTVVGNFCIIAPLGKGGMGEVWLAEQQSIKTKVAIKLLNADISADVQHVQRFFNEAVAVSKIRHAGIVKIFDVGFVGQQAYLVMEYLEGEPLSSRIHRRGRLSPAEVCDVGRQVAGVLDATHAAGITHRDLKPDNIFLVPDAEQPSGERAKVLDFGIAKLSSVGMTSTSVSSMGTPLYMSPEQWKNVAKVDGRTDAYSLGCVVFEMACGRPPFLAESMGEACAKHLTEEPPRASSITPGLPPAFDQLVARLLEKEAAARPTVKEAMVALAAIAQTVPAAPPAGTYAGSPPLPAGPVSPVAATVGTFDSARPVAVPPATALPPHGSQVAPHAGTGQPMAPYAATGQPMAPYAATGQPMAPYAGTGQPMMPPVTTLGGSAGASGAAPQVNVRRGKRAGWLIAGGALLVAGGATAAVVLATGGSSTPPASPSSQAASEPSGSQTSGTHAPPPPTPAPPAPSPPPEKPDEPPPPLPLPIPGIAQGSLVSPTAVHLVSGDWPKDLKATVSAQICIDTAGAVSNVYVGLDVQPQLGKEIEEKLLTWRYEPYRREGSAIAVCFVATHLYAPPPAKPPKPPRPPEPPKPPPPPAPSLPETLDRAAIVAVMAQLRGRVVACAPVRLVGRGTVKVAVTVAPGGQVQTVQVTQPPRPAVIDCVSRVVQTAVFPKTVRGASFTYPFAL